jgi:hypothetical protein
LSSSGCRPPGCASQNGNAVTAILTGTTGTTIAAGPARETSPAGSRADPHRVPLWLLPIGFVALVAAVATGLRGVPAVQQLIARYPGIIAPTGRGSPDDEWRRGGNEFNDTGR